MKRGFPRPQMHVDTCSTNVIVDSSGRKFYGADYGDKWNNKTYPVPYTAEEQSISSLHTGRLSECAKFKKCIACGDPVEGNEVSVLRKNGKIFSESGPFHDKCSRLVKAMCPHIAVSSEYEFSTEVWANVKTEIVAHLT